MTAYANLLAVNPAERAKRIDWLLCHRNRIEAGFELPANITPHAAHLATMARLSEIKRDAETVRETLAFGGGI